MAGDNLRLPTAEDVAAARSNIQGRAVRIPLLKLNADLAGVNIFLKLENLQPLGSFKIRPAVNVLSTLNAKTLTRGVLTSSAGNFGQGLAFAARALGVPTTVVVPDTAASNKAAALAALGAKVIRVSFEICEAIRCLAARHHVIAEAAGAASVAAAMAGRAGQGNIVCIVSGGNIDAPKLGAILNGRDPF